MLTHCRAPACWSQLSLCSPLLAGPRQAHLGVAVGSRLVPCGPACGDFGRTAQSRSSQVACAAGSSAGEQGRAVTHSTPLPLRVVEAYRVVQDPALHNRRFTDALKDFAQHAVLAYECGYTEDTVRAQLAAMAAGAGAPLDPQACFGGADGTTAAAPAAAQPPPNRPSGLARLSSAAPPPAQPAQQGRQDDAGDGGGASLHLPGLPALPALPNPVGALLGGANKRRRPLPALDEAQCLLYVSIVWITLMLSHKNVRRWSLAGTPVAEERLAQWRGFVTMIVSAYYDKRWAWYPIDRLQMEVAAVTGVAHPPAVVAEWARIVYTTLEVTAPQFSSDI